MKNFTFILLFSCILGVAAQNSQRPVPESWNIATIEKFAPIELEKPNLALFKAQDAVNDLDRSIPWRFGYDHFVDFGLDTAGKWHSLPNGDRIWRIKFISPDALSMNLIFDRYNIPIGGKVYIYSGDKSQILNVFTHQHNSPEEILGTWMVNGESIWIEYFEPKKVSGQGRLNIGNVIHGYRTLKTLKADQENKRPLNDSGDCNVDVNCDITATSAVANDIKNDVKKSVGMVIVGGNGTCSGALINNTNNDGTPYFLTANHCLGGSVAGWAFRFNWASDASVADCATASPSVDNTFIQTASGGVLRASNSESDMALIEITDVAFFAASPDVVWAGWDRSIIAIPTLNVGVHHPSGDLQKVSVDLEGATRVTMSFNGNPTTEVWQIADWDLGVTEPGSSGSPLFNQNGLIIGDLTGGSTACSGTVDNGGFVIYGRFGVSWDFGTTNETQLKFWLDPVGTNPTTLQQFPTTQISSFDAAISVLNIPTDLCDATITPTLRITNAGSTTLTSATITHQLDTDTPVVINWTGNLAMDAFEDIPLTAIAVSGAGAHSFTASVANPNGNVDESPSNDASTQNFSIPDTFDVTTIRVIITPDRYGSETTWQLTDSAGALIAQAPVYDTTGTNGTQPDVITDVPITVLDECYTFIIYDSYGDGMCCAYGAGTYRLEDLAGNILINGNGDFGADASHLFRVGAPVSGALTASPEVVTDFTNIDGTGNSTISWSTDNSPRTLITLTKTLVDGSLSAAETLVTESNIASGSVIADYISEGQIHTFKLYTGVADSSVLGDLLDTVIVYGVLVYNGGAWINSVAMDATTAAKDAYIDGDLILSSNAEINNLDVAIGGSLTLNSGVSLIVNGTSSGNVTYNTTLGTENWYLVSSPVAGETYDNAYVAANSLAINGTNNAIATYTTADNTWSYMQTGGGATFTPGTGYSVRRADAAGSGNISFTGTINTDPVTPAVIADDSGFNLIGNPFTAYLNSASFLTDNTANLVSETIWVWNQAAENYETKVTNEAFVLAPTQGFFVRASSPTNLSIAESYQATTGSIFQRTAKTEVKLMMNDGTNNRFAKVYYVDNATTGFDNGYDGETFGGIANTVDVFTHLVADSQGKKYQVQSLPKDNYENMVIPIGVIAASGREIIFSAEALNLPSGIKVFLEDKLTNTFTDLDEVNSNYKIKITAALNGIGRFYLHTTSSVLSANTIVLENVSIYKKDNTTLRIVGVSEGKTTLKLFSVLGKQVLNTSYSSNGVKEVSIPKLATGVYIVRLETVKGTINKKIIIVKI
jgi:lysyl endopeptidase